MARDEPAIAIWETGNELSAPTAWTAAIAAFIRAADPNHLVMGTCHNMSGGSSAPFPKLTLAPYPGPARPQPNLIFCEDGNYGIVAAHLDIADIDVVSDHFYPPDLQRFASGVAAAAAAGKVYSAGEFGWSQGGPVDGLLAACLAAQACAQASVWSFFPHADSFGFVQHNDGFTIHFPGWGFASELAIVQTMRNFSAAMMALPAPAAYPAPSTPLVSSAVGGRVAWRGAALAATYDVQTAAAAGGPWTTVSPSPGPTDNDAPWAVPGGLAAGAWVRLRGVGLDGAAGPWSAPAQAQAQADAPTASATRIEASCASSSVRVRIAPAGAPPDVEPTVQARRDACGGGPSDPGALTFGNIRAAFDAASGLLSVSRVSDGAVLLAEVAGSRMQAPRGEVDMRGNALFSSAIAFAFPAGGAAVYGLGEHKTGRVDYAAAGGFSWRFEDSQNKATNADNGDISLPVLHTSSGVTVMLNVPSYGSIGVTPDGFTLTVNSSATLDLWFSVADADAPTWPSLMGHLAQVIGPPAPLPTWATGFVQCKLRYRNQTELLAAAQGYVDRGYPISAIVIDYMSWPMFGTWQYIQRCWPDPGGMVRQLDAWGIALMQSVWPNIESGSFRFPEMQARGYLTTDANGTAQPFNRFDYPTYIYDPFNAGARAYLSQALFDGYGAHGVSSYWLDADEPQGAQPGREYYSAGRDVEVGLAFPRMHQQGIFEGQLARGAATAMSLSRGTWLGAAQYGGAVWSGDVQSNWTSFQQQVAIAQNMALSGVWLWTSEYTPQSGPAQRPTPNST